MADGCVFCKIAAGEAPAYKVNEDQEHLAFLDIVPLVEGQTVVIPKKHYGNYHFDLPEDAYTRLLSFARSTAKKLDAALKADRTLMVAQGYAIDHVHVKLFPVFKVHSRTVDQKTYDQLISLLKGKWYSGYLISMSGKEKADPKAQSALQKKILAIS